MSLVSRFPFLSQPRFWWFGVAVWFIVLFIASSQAKVMPPAVFTSQDKVEHTLYFAAGGFCFARAMQLQGRLRSIIMLLLGTVLFCSLIGASDEFHQSFTPGRSGNDPFDWMADTLGGLLAGITAWVLRPRE